MFNLLEKPINTKIVIVQQIKGVDQLLNKYSLFQHNTNKIPHCKRWFVVNVVSIIIDVID